MTTRNDYYYEAGDDRLSFSSDDLPSLMYCYNHDSSSHVSSSPQLRYCGLASKPRYEYDPCSTRNGITTSLVCQQEFAQITMSNLRPTRPVHISVTRKPTKRRPDDEEREQPDDQFSKLDTVRQ